MLMLSEDRVIHMSRMAMEEKTGGRMIGPVIRYHKKDYVTLCTIGGIVLGTLFYLLIYAGALLFAIGTWTVNISLEGVILTVLLGIILYLLYMFVYLRMVRRHAVRRYEEGARLAKRQKKEYHILQQMYREDELAKTPEGWN